MLFFSLVFLLHFCIALTKRHDRCVARAPMHDRAYALPTRSHIQTQISAHISGNGDSESLLARGDTACVLVWCNLYIRTLFALRNKKTKRKLCWNPSLIANKLQITHGAWKRLHDYVAPIKSESEIFCKSQRLHSFKTYQMCCKDWNIRPTKDAFPVV